MDNEVSLHFSPSLLNILNMVSFSIGIFISPKASSIFYLKYIKSWDTGIYWKSKNKSSREVSCTKFTSYSGDLCTNLAFYFDRRFHLVIFPYYIDVLIWDVCRSKALKETCNWRCYELWRYLSVPFEWRLVVLVDTLTSAEVDDCKYCNKNILKHICSLLTKH